MKFKLARTLFLITAFCLLPLVSQAQLALTPLHYQQLNQLQEAFNAEATNQEAEAKEQLAAAEQQAKQVIAQVKGSPEQQAFVRMFATRLLAQHLVETNQLKQAAKLLQQELERSGPHLEIKHQQEANWQLIHLLTQQGEYQQALKQLEIWWQQEEAPSAEAKYLRAALLSQLAKWQPAKTYILQALEEEQPEAWLRLGVAIMQNLEDWAKAAELQYLRLQLAPNKSSHWLALAQLQLLAQQENQALITLKLAEQQGYLPTQQIENLGLRLLANKQTLIAAKVFNQLLKNQPNNLQLHKYAAQAWLLSKSPKEATLALEKLAKLENTSQNFTQLGQWYFSLGEWRLAADNFKQALELVEKKSAQQTKNQDLTKQQNLLKLQLAQSYIELAELNLAKELLVQLKDSHLKSQATQWLSYLAHLNSSLSSR